MNKYKDFEDNWYSEKEEVNLEEIYKYKMLLRNKERRSK